MRLARRAASDDIATASSTASGNPASDSALRPRASAVAAARSASATQVAVYVFVAATARSRPARSANTCSAVRASRDRGLLVRAIVTAPARRPSRTTAATSGEAPDCEMPMTAPRPNAGAAS